MSKKRILLCNEASFLATGFSTYGLEVMKRLHATGKYELAEFASYGGTENTKETRHHQLPWKYYPNLPQSAAEAEIYEQKQTNAFGEWKFESVALDFKPDIVWDIRDWWMLEYQERSPFRRFYNWAIMPTVDARPQDEQWVATYMNADGVFTYSDWGLTVLKEQSNNKIKTICAAPPGIDVDAYFLPEDKSAHRASMGISREAYIIGTVMRNQSRKLYPDLIQAFVSFINQAPPEISKKSYLYLHCAYPDLHWNIPLLIKEAGIASRTILTYFCKSCSAVFPSFYQDVIGVCRHCGERNAILPRTQMGISRKDLGKIYAMFDVYVQYANSEGFGLPQIEAAACGVPICSVDYSAMSDVVRKLEGHPIKVQRMYREPESHCYRALPDNQDLVEYLLWFFKTAPENRRARAQRTRELVQKEYSWDRTAKAWETYFDSVAVNPNRWDSPAKLHSPADQAPPNLNNEEFVKWAIEFVGGRPDLVNSYFALRLTRDLNWGAYKEGTGGIYFNDASSLGQMSHAKEFGRQELIQIVYEMCERNNFWEKQRVSRG